MKTETKFTEEYAKKLAKLHLVEIKDVWSEASFIKGYMEALKQTAAPELLEALIEANNLLVKLREKLSMPQYGIILSDKLIEKNFEAIKKATE